MVLTHVERVLLNYCPPGRHEYAVDSADSRKEQCRACGRRQRVDGATCMLCEADGNGEFVLASVEDATQVEGPLCDTCLRELRFRGEVRRWALASLHAA